MGELTPAVRVLTVTLTVAESMIEDGLCHPTLNDLLTKQASRQIASQISKAWNEKNGR